MAKARPGSKLTADREPLKAWASREWRYHVGLVRTLLRVRSIRPDSPHLACDDLEQAVDRWADSPAIRFQGGVWSYADLDRLANRVAHWAVSQGLQRGDIVAVVLPNRPEYLPIWFGLSKVGVVAALINPQLPGPALAHCLNISTARVCIGDGSTALALREAGGSLRRDWICWSLDGAMDGVKDLSAALAAGTDRRPDRAARAGMTASDPALLIYTSGTTGLPKAAKVTHVRAGLYMRGFAGAVNAHPNDRLYLTLPLYHATGGLCAMGAALLNGASVVLRESFSARHFWADVQAEQATIFVYVGELCRYLANQPATDQERGHRLRLAFGNGMPADVWRQMAPRFGVAQVLEFYGATEGNVSLFNFDGRIGALGRVAPWLASLFKVELVRWDAEAEGPVREARGLCIPVDPGEIGLCLGVIAAGARQEFAGYVDRAASDKKVLHDVRRKGDRWFITGDLMRRDGEGYFYFVDRVGDTFRWKGENVSTREVELALLTVPGVREAVVYGVSVPGHDGRAGMAALVVDPDFRPTDLAGPLGRALPLYARPLFLRITRALEVTGTFKPRKTELVAQGFDPAVVADPVWVADPAEGYVRLDAGLCQSILNGSRRV